MINKLNKYGYGDKNNKAYEFNEEDTQEVESLYACRYPKLVEVQKWRAGNGN